jgi:hypothetical protein
MSNFLDEPFNLEEEKGSTFSLIPADTYKAVVTSATYGPLKSGRGDAVKLTWQIEGGDFDHRLVFQSLNIRHDSGDAQRIGREQFKDVCSALGLSGEVKDLDTLLWKPARIHVGVRVDKNGDFPDQNEVRRVRPWVEGWAKPLQRPQAEVLKEASTVQPAFKATDEPMNDEVPF